LYSVCRCQLRSRRYLRQLWFPTAGHHRC
jgi:hypothetical protein